MAGDHGQPRQQRHRFQLAHVPAGPGQRATRMIALTNAGAVGKEDHVELAALGDLGALHIMLDVQRAVGRHIGMAPGGRVIPMAAYRQTEPHLACRHSLRLLTRGSFLVLRPIDNAGCAVDYGTVDMRRRTCWKCGKAGAIAAACGFAPRLTSTSYPTAAARSAPRRASCTWARTPPPSHCCVARARSRPIPSAPASRSTPSARIAAC